MRLIALTVAATATLGLTACGERETKSDVPDTPGVHVQGREGDQTITMNSQGEQVVLRSGAAATTEGAPAFAQPYPGATVTQSIQAGEGRMIVFNTNANPDTVIEYYRQRAEEAGLSSGASMSMGDTRMYGADQTGGGSLQVMVAPADGQSSVTVTWTEAG